MISRILGIPENFVLKIHVTDNTKIEINFKFHMPRVTFLCRISHFDSNHCWWRVIRVLSVRVCVTLVSSNQRNLEIVMIYHSIHWRNVHGTRWVTNYPALDILIVSKCMTLISLPEPLWWTASSRRLLMTARARVLSAINVPLNSICRGFEWQLFYKYTYSRFPHLHEDWLKRPGRLSPNMLQSSTTIWNLYLFNM